MEYNSSKSAERRESGQCTITTANLLRRRFRQVVSENETPLLQKKEHLLLSDQCLQDRSDNRYITRKTDADSAEILTSVTLGPSVPNDPKFHVLLSISVLAETAAETKS